MGAVSPLTCYAAHAWLLLTSLTAMTVIRCSATPRKTAGRTHSNTCCHHTALQHLRPLAATSSTHSSSAVPPPPHTPQVKHIIVCGHYNCGAVKAALQLPSKTPGLVNCWISDIRECRNHHMEELRAVEDPHARLDMWATSTLHAARCTLHAARCTLHATGASCLLPAGCCRPPGAWCPLPAAWGPPVYMARQSAHHGALHASTHPQLPLLLHCCPAGCVSSM